MKNKLTLSSGEGEVSFSIVGKELEIEIFQQNSVKEVLSEEDLIELRNWLEAKLNEKVNQKLSHPFKVGQTVKILDNLCEELITLGMSKSESVAFHNKWVGMYVNVMATWSDENQHWVTVDMCCEVPVQCCEIYREQKRLKKFR